MRRLIACGLLLVCVAPGCKQPAPPMRHLVLSGSRSMAPLLDEIGDRFEMQQGDVRIDVEPTSTVRAVHDTRQGLADIGMLGRDLRPGETGLRAHALARDGLAVILHPTNPVAGLTGNQLVGVFTRYYVRWKEVGGTDRPIVVVNQAEGRAARDVLIDYLGLQPPQLRPDRGVATGEEVVRAVAGHPGAIGYVSLGRALPAPVKRLPLAGVAATRENVRTGHYPLVRTLNLLTREPPIGLVKEFLDFARSAEVHDLLEKHGFVPVSP